MPRRWLADDEYQIIHDLLEQQRGHGAALAASQMPQPYKDTLTVASTPQTTWQLTYVPLANSVDLKWNGQGTIEGVDYTIDYTTGIVTFLSPLQTLLRATPAPADVLEAEYWTTGDLIALSTPVDSGPLQLSDFTQDGGTWSVDTSSVSGFIVSAAGGGATRFKPAGSLGFYLMRHNQGVASLNVTFDYLSLTNVYTDGITFGFDPSVGSGYLLGWNQSSSANGGMTLYRTTSDTAILTALADATASPLGTGWGATGWAGTTAHFSVTYNSSTGAIAAAFGLGVTPTTRITYTDATPLTGTWWGPAEYVNNQGNGKWLNFVTS